MRTNALSDDPLQGLLSISQVAAMLGVHVSTVRRWIASGKVPAYRVGDKGIRLRSSDVTALINPLALSREAAHGGPKEAGMRVPPLTTEQQQRGLEAAASLERARARDLESRGGVPFESSDNLIREMREARTRDLLAALEE